MSLNEGDLASYRVTLDRAGQSRHRASGCGRPAEARCASRRRRPPTGETRAAGGRGGAGRAAGRGGGAAGSLCRCPAASRRRFRGRHRPASGRLEHHRAGARRQHPSRVSQRRRRNRRRRRRARTTARFGPFALYVGGTGEVRFKDVSYKDLQPRVAQPETVSPRFRMQTLNEFYYSWGPAVADFNRDGTPDIVAGPYYYLGPDYNVAREIYIGGDDRSGHAVLQRPAVRLRLHRRRMAGRAELGFHAAGDSLRQSEGRVAALGRPTPSPTACRASSCCSRTSTATASSSSSSRTARTSSSTRSPIPRIRPACGSSTPSASPARGPITAWASATSTATAASIS